MYRPTIASFRQLPEALFHLFRELGDVGRALEQASIFAVGNDTVIVEEMGLIALGVEVDSASVVLGVEKNGVPTDYQIEAIFAENPVQLARFSQPLTFARGDQLAFVVVSGSGTVLKQTAWLQMA